MISDLTLTSDLVTSITTALAEPAMPAFVVPPEDSITFARLPQDVRDDVNARLACFRAIARRIAPRADGSRVSLRMACHEQAAIWHGKKGWSAIRIRTQFEAYLAQGDWRACMNKAKAGPEFWESEEPVTLPADFVEYWKTLLQQNQLADKPAWRELKRRYDTGFTQLGEPVTEWPGYTAKPAADPFTGLPKGWSYRNLSRYNLSKFEKKAARQGRRAASAHRLQVYTTRVGLKVGQFYMVDDQWYDLKVNHLGYTRKAMRPLGLNVLDVFSGCCFAQLHKLMLWDEIEEKRVQLKESDMVWFVVHILTEFGYRTDEIGTTFVVELGTAAIRKELAQRIADVTGGCVTVQRSEVDNRPTFPGLFEGASKGNFRFKASLESLFRYVRTEMAALPGATGNSRDHAPEQMHGADAYNTKLLLAAEVLTPERAQMLKFPFLSYGEFSSLTLDVYRAINNRKEHDLEGWVEAKLLAKEWRIDPQSDKWYPAHAFTQLPTDKRAALEALLDRDLSLTRLRKLSPQEVFDDGSHALTRLPRHLIPSLVGREHGVPRKIEDGLLVFRDQDIEPDKIRFNARINDERIKDGTYLIYVSPLNPTFAIVCDLDNAYLGTIYRTQKHTRAELEGLHRAMGEARAAEAKDLAPIAARGAKQTREKIAMHRHNAAVLNGEVLTAEEQEIAAILNKYQSASEPDGEPVTEAATPTPKKEEPKRGVTIEDLRKLA